MRLRCRFVVMGYVVIIEKLRYMHRNPVTRGLVEKPEQWPWSSFLDYLHGQTGKVRVNDTDLMKMRIKPSAA